mgnify:CR=1 FL=1
MFFNRIYLDDLYQIACIGFIEAIQRFDFSYNLELSTYSVQYMLGEIRKFIRDDGIIKVSRSIKELGIKINVESINSKVFDDEKELIETISLGEDEQSKIVDKITILDLIEKLNIRDKQIINLRYFKDKTQSQVARLLGISQVHVSRIEKKILNDFRKKLLA